MNENERAYWKSIGMLPEEGSDRKSLGEWMATPEGQALHARLKAAAAKMEARIPRSYKRTAPTWGEAHKDELPDIVMCFCGETVRRWSWGEKRNWPAGGPHICPLDEPREEAKEAPALPNKPPRALSEHAAKTEPGTKETKSPDFLV